MTPQGGGQAPWVWKKETPGQCEMQRPAPEIEASIRGAWR